MRVLGGIASLFLVVGLAACSDDDGAKISCLPVEELVATKSVEGKEAAPEKIITNVYLDTSISMRGFLKDVASAKVKESMFRPFISNIPALFDTLTPEPINYHFFGDKIKDVPEQNFITASTESPYTEKYTRLGIVLNEIVQEYDDTEESSKLSLVISDMFLSTGEIVTGKTGPIFRPLSNLIRNGATVALVGARNPFDYTIYDLPGSKGTISEYKGERPFYIFVIGQQSVVEKTVNALYNELTIDAPAGAVNAVIFGNGGVKASEPLELDTVNTARGLGAVKFSPKNPFAELPENVGYFKVSEGNGRISIPIPNLNDAFKNFYVHSTAAYTKVNLSSLSYAFHDPEDCRRSWNASRTPAEDADVSGVVNLYSSDARVAGELTLLKDEKVKFRLLPLTVYHLEFGVYSPPVTNAETAIPPWISEWSFEPGEVAELINSPPAFFPTLNLEAITKILISLTTADQESRLLARGRITYEKE